MVDIDHFIPLPKSKSDNIEMIMLGPYVERLRSVFEQIDHVRSMDGFGLTYRLWRE